MATQIKPKGKASKNGRGTVKAPQKSPRKNENVSTPERTTDPKNLEAIRFLDSLDDVTPEQIQEQKETWAFLKKALDEDRLSPNRPLFPNGDEDNKS